MNALKGILAGVVCITIAIVLLSGLANGLLERAGFAYAPSFHAASMNVRVGDQRFQIPPNYLFAPLQVTGRDGDFDVVRAIGAIGLAPDFTPRDRSNERRFHEPLCCFRVLITPMAVSADVFMSRTLKSWFSELEVLNKEDDGRVTHYEVRSPNRFLLLSEYGDLYVNDDQSQAVRCNRRDTEGINHIVNILCVTFSAGQGNVYQITVPNNDPPLRDRQLKVIWGVVHSWMK
jgi:hypothetical protein